MARIKQEIKRQQRAGHGAGRPLTTPARAGYAQRVVTYVPAPDAAGTDPLVTIMASHGSPPPPVNECIDLTFDDDSEDNDEPMGTLSTNSSSLSRTRSFDGVASVASKVSDAESDVDEALPIAPKLSVPQTKPAATGDSLEDGEIFEEGAVIKSPTAVKEAIELERQAARALAADEEQGTNGPAKKKQKKRGRKKSKRKVEMMMAEFNVRPPTVGPMGMPVPPLPPPSMIPPHRPLHPFPIAPPPGPFSDERIVRVTRHGHVAPFQTQHGSPDVPPPLPEPMLGGFRYRSVQLATPGAQRPDFKVSSLGPRGLKRPLSWSDSRDTEAKAGDDAFDLDSLRAAALRTKRLTKEAENETKSATVSRTSTPGRTEASGDGGGDDVEDLDELRAELLRSLSKKSKRKKEGGTPESTSRSQAGGNDENDNRDRVTTAEPSVQADSTASITQSPPSLPQSPVFRPLTALSQSIVIQLSIDDIGSSKLRADSFDDTRSMSKSDALEALRQKIREKEGAVGKSSVQSTPTINSKPNAAGLPSKKIEASQSRAGLLSAIDAMKKQIADMEKMRASEASALDKSSSSSQNQDKLTSALNRDESASVKAPEQPSRASQASTTPPLITDEQKHPQPSRLLEMEQMKAERAACIRDIQEADEHIRRLDSEIARVKQAIAAAEAERVKRSMANKECLTCKPGDATYHQSAVENTGCETSYQRVDDCMKKHNGRVSACTEEWAVFRKCHEQAKALKAELKKQEQK
ncbi:hypothetical protein Poli38472_010085 [Pythium oligandrum]|uniref:CHCH domain-containing protein n=1 Tax=Pythium oligandrum TaxID=41045 RepID=A0A8K1C8U0_PYTOL|nr:hypothetical protein Poli38472_010085 [Pythium oligandrum]|eukprot:TMW58526.1 hypothetical protein Poli38472_010085 [Pythium oligandrum]